MKLNPYCNIMLLIHLVNFNSIPLPKITLLSKLVKGEKLPLFTSCCPSWVKYCEIYHQDLICNLSSTKSPIMMQAGVINECFFKNKNNKKVINVMLAPCTAKKMEIKRPNLMM